MTVSIYAASPLGFSEAGRHYYQEKFLPALARAGFKILDPWTLTDQSLMQSAAALPLSPQLKQTWVELNRTIGANNAAAIRECQIVIAVLDGTDVDSGTASEIGYAAALGKIILGYRGDFRLSADNIGGIVNLQVEYFIRASGGDICLTLETLEPLLHSWYKKLSAG